MRFSHITIQTDKAAEEIRFYENWAGLKIIRQFGNIAFLGNETADETKIEIIDKEMPVVDASGLSIGFETEDVCGLRQRMLEAGMKPTELIRPMPAVCFFFVKDPAGLNVQFIGK